MGFRLGAVALICVMLSGCSVYMAASGEAKRDMNVLTTGTSRDIVLAEFGAPVSTIDEPVAADMPEAKAALQAGQPVPRRRYDIFKFVQGRSTGSNAGRAVLYGAAAVFTLGLSEVVTTPLEYAVGDQGEIRLRTNYDLNWRLTDAQVQDGNDWVTISEYRARVLEREKALNAASGASSN